VPSLLGPFDAIDATESDAPRRPQVNRARPSNRANLDVTVIPGTSCHYFPLILVLNIS
jgi:hypothetical protein